MRKYKIGEKFKLKYIESNQTIELVELKNVSCYLAKQEDGKIFEIGEFYLEMYFVKICFD